ncbi:hypothetical protein B2G71_02485 [Novosphingobium sp. PC22D]|uniref:hypothetical protein n=1 Tax=Novosphingobium sp. PC22D TaxID=1962403 RepID=UPI000BF09261|nr:hypothetical protein [Novosphingobium sp. PC22D]PEQ14472.1 hypothetical protein B2G71_02485 [Novosphingobium sp. PC22D]
MVEMIEANWLIFIAALIIGIIVAWWLFGRGSKGTVRERRPDVLDEGAAPARRNQALIDAPPAASLSPPPAAGTMAGIGEVVTAAAQEEVEASERRASPPPSAPESAAPPPSEPAPDPTPAPAPPAPAGSSDDLRKIKGVGPKLAALLQSIGVTSYAQIAGWSDADLDALDAQLGSFAGRPRRDNWIEQAKLLSSGDTAAYEAKFGKL